MIRVHRPTEPLIFSNNPLRKKQQELIRGWWGTPPAERRQRDFGSRWANSIPGFMKALRGAFSNKCAFCESGLAADPDDTILAFFRPPEGALQLDRSIDPDHYWWLKWEWSNLYLACQTCGFQKGRLFPTLKRRAAPDTYGDKLQEESPFLLDPCLDDPSQHLFFEETGRVCSYKGSDRGTATINTFNLNREELLQARAYHARATKALLQACLGAKEFAGDGAERDISSNINELVLRCESDQPYAGMTRQLLQRWLGEVMPASQAVHGILSAFLDNPLRPGVVGAPVNDQSNVIGLLSCKLDALIDTLSKNLADNGSDAANDTGHAARDQRAGGDTPGGYAVGGARPARHRGADITFSQGYALIIGIASYPHVRGLPETVLKDAQDVKQLLCSSAHCGYPESHVRLLLDSEATAAGILDGFRWLAQSSGPDDTAVLFFSGRGGRRHGETGTVNYLIPFDCRAEELEATAISGDRLTELLRAVPAQHLLALFDSHPSDGAGTLTGLDSAEFEMGFGDDYYGSLAQGTGRVIVASSRPDEVSLVLEGMDNSLFAYYLLEALRGGARTRADGLIRVFDLFDYVSEKVPARGKQHPIFKLSDLENNFPIGLYEGGKQVEHSSPAAEMPITQVNRRELRDAVTKYFKIEELEILCDDIRQDLADAGIELDVSLEQLGEGGKVVKVLRLIEYLDRRRHLAYMVAAIRRARPGII